MKRLFSGEDGRFARLLVVFALAGPVYAAEGDTVDIDTNEKVDNPALHPAIPLLDEEGRHVLDSGKPYSPRQSCGSSNCHDYDAITSAYHFEMGRDEASDDFGALHGLPHLVSPGYFGGYACMGGSNPEVLAKKNNATADDFADRGAAGWIIRCLGCHTGGGWAEKDRNGRRYDETDPGSVRALDGDYFNRGTDENNQDAGITTVARWDWKKSGVVEADCLLCHADFTRLTKGDPALAGEDSSDALTHLRELRRTYLVRGYRAFRFAPSATLEFFNLHHEACGENEPGCAAEDRTLLTFVRDLEADPPIHSRAEPAYALLLNEDGEPRINWNRNAFDEDGKVKLPLLRFPGNDNCMVCHRTSNSRRGFYGFGEGAEAVYDEETGILIEDYQDDVHKGKLWTDPVTGEERRIENCNTCHARNYFRAAWANTDLNANHDILKGNSDMDVRNDLDYNPNARSCEYCHDESPQPVIPSGQKDMVTAHLERWKHSGHMAGYPESALARITRTHLEVISCQACHITGKKGRRGRDLQIMYRYRQAEDGSLKIVPYNPRIRYYWKDRNSGRILTRHERNSVFEERRDGQGDRYGVIVDPESGRELARVSARISHGSVRYGDPEDYAGFLALKRAYDKLLARKGVSNPDTVMMWTESNEYLMSHNTRPATASVPCEACHNRKQNGSFSALLSSDGLFGSGRVKEVTRLVDRRLLDEGIVELDLEYMKMDNDGVVTENVADILSVTRVDPFMTILKASSARVALGRVSRVSSEKGLAAIGATGKGAAVLAERFGLDEMLLYRPVYGDEKLRRLAVMPELDGTNERVFPSYRLRAAIADDGIIAAARGAGLGELASPVFLLQARDAQGEPVNRFTGVLIKLPYGGVGESAGEVKVLHSADGVQWSALDEGSIVMVQPRSAEADGMVVFHTTHFSYYAVADTDSATLSPQSSSSSGGGGGAVSWWLPLIGLLWLVLNGVRRRDVCA